MCMTAVYRGQVVSLALLRVSKFGHGRFQTCEEKAKFYGGAVAKKAKTEAKA